MNIWKRASGLFPLGLAAGLAIILAGCGGGEGQTDNGVVVVTDTDKLAEPESPAEATEPETPEETPAATEEGPQAATGWGTLKGRITFEGDVPEPKVLVAQGDTDVKDAAVCAKEPIVSEELVVDPETKGVKWAIVYIPRPTAVHPEAESEAASAQVEFDQKGCTFTPHVLAVMKGATIQLKSSDPVGHNVHSQLRFTSLNQGLQPGMTVPLTIQVPDNRPGPIFCDIHNWMKAWWLTLNNPYFAVTNDKGEYEIDRVPAGEQHVVVWTESANLLTPSSGEAVAIQADGTTEKDFSFDASKIK